MIAMKITILIVLIILGGCSTTQTLKNANLIDDKQKLNDIRLYVDDGTGGNGNAYNYDYNIINHFRESNVFHTINTHSSPYKIEVFLNVINNNTGGIHYAYELIRAGTLFAMPSKEDTTFKIEINVLYPNGKKSYKYEDRRTWVMSILNPQTISWEMDSPQRYKAINNMLDNFFVDLKKDNIIPYHQQSN